MGGLRLVNRGLGIIRVGILARILTPSQFGTFGIALLVLGFLEIATETGVNVFLIQEKDKLKEYISSAWIVSILRGLFIGIVIFISAPYIVTFFNAPDAIGLLMLTGIIPIIRGFVNPAVVKFQINLEFNKEFIKESFLFFVETVLAVTIGLATRSESAFIFAMLGSASVEVIISFVLIKPRPKVAFELDKIKKVVNSGKWITGSGIFDYIFTHIDDVIVGRVLGTYLLGLYQNAYKISTLLVIETEKVFNKVAFPVYSRLVGDELDDKKRLLKGFLSTSLVIILLALPLGILIIIFSREIILFILGDKWLEAEAVLKVLTVYGILKAISNSTNSLFLALKMQKVITFITFVSTSGLLITIIPLVARYGMIGAAYSTIIGTLIGLPISIFYIRKVFVSK